MSETTNTEAAATTTDAPVKAAKPPVLDGRVNGDRVSIELGMRVKLLGQKDIDANGGDKPEGVVTGIEYQRQRVVVALDNGTAVVRPAAKVWVLKTKSGKVERVERAVRAGKKATTPEAPAAE